jgi:NAD-dependent deacetylase
MTYERIVILTGAGLSAESGLGTFRGADGLWDAFDIEEVATPEGFARNPVKVHDFYNMRRGWLKKAKPNAAHMALAQLEHDYAGDVLTVTQNIDGLHEAAGCHHLIHMHGELARALCARCGTSMPWTEDLSLTTDCPVCHKAGFLRPDVVWFGEMLPPGAIEAAFEAAQRCDVLLLIGTSGVVQPAASLAEVGKSYGARLIEINPNPTPLSSLADVCIAQGCQDALTAINDAWLRVGC